MVESRKSKVESQCEVNAETKFILAMLNRNLTS